MSKKDSDLVPYYRPGTTEPEMVPRDSVEGQKALAASGAVEVESEAVTAEVEEEPKVAAPKSAAKKAAKKK